MTGTDRTDEDRPGDESPGAGGGIPEESTDAGGSSPDGVDDTGGSTPDESGDGDSPRVAVFRPDDERLAAALEHLESLGARPVADPMLAVEPTGRDPREDADIAILTSKTGVDIAAEAGWTPGGEVAAIGEPTADHLRAAGYRVDVVPAEFSSAGLVDALEERVDGRRVEVARSDHGTPALLAGLEDAGAYVHETVLYRLVRPGGSGRSTELAAAGDLDAALFTSSLVVEHFLEATKERGVRGEALAGLADAVVGAIGEPTRETALEAGLTVDVVPGTATFERLAAAALDRLER